MTGKTAVRQAALLQTDDDILNAENEWLGPAGTQPFRAGLALSGGGVRAATVALGVLQTLAKEGLLTRFQYLSTVSGGGYIGGALSWFWCQKRADDETDAAGKLRFGAAAGDFPFQDPLRDPPQDSHARALHEQAVLNLAFLRNHGSYLTSGDGIGFAGLIVAALRTILLSLGIWLPLLLAFFLIVRLVEEAWSGPSCVGAGLFAVMQCRPVYFVLIGLVALVTTIFYAAIIGFSFLPRLWLLLGLGSSSRKYLPIFLCLAGSGLMAFLVYRTYQNVDTPHPPIIAQSVLLALMAAAGLLLAAALFLRPQNPDYVLRRSFEWGSSFMLPLTVAGLYIGLLPLIVDQLKPDEKSPAFLKALGSLGPAITLLSGVCTALYGYYAKAKSILPGPAGQAFATAGAVVFMAGMALLSFVAAEQLIGSGENNHNPYLLGAIIALVVLAVAAGFYGSVNTTGLHRFYRDRLMETFMPMASAVRNGDARESDLADNLSMVDVVHKAAEYGGRGDRPYHIVNAHVILTNEQDAKVVVRGGDNFVMSPALVGSSRTGWVRTEDYVRRHGALTLASAMATSGAAANANAGYIGHGITRDRFVSAVMAILNVRLGLWVGNPRAVADIDMNNRSLVHSPPHFIKPKVPSFFWPVLSSGILGFGNHSAATYLELSDGGHFENLGVYELIRRRLDLVVVVDAEQDITISLSALVSSRNRVKEDFGVDIKFNEAKGAEILLGQKSERYPSGVQIAQSPYLVAKILYPPTATQRAKEGVLIYIKSNMSKELEFATEGYKAANPDFPHQSTADQFFDPEQFEAYRDLGQSSCRRVIRDLNLKKNFADIAQIQTAYDPPKSRFNYRQQQRRQRLKGRDADL